MKFDNEISVRTAVLTGVVAWLTGPKMGLQAEVAAGIGALVGYLLDKYLFGVKAKRSNGVKQVD